MTSFRIYLVYRSNLDYWQRNHSELVYKSNNDYWSNTEMARKGYFQKYMIKSEQVKEDWNGYFFITNSHVNQLSPAFICIIIIFFKLAEWLP